MIRRALLIGNGSFAEEPRLSPLRGPPVDVRSLAQVLADPVVGKFEVQELVDAKSFEVRRAVGRLLNRAAADDLVLLYYSGHGKLSYKGQLCLCAADTVVEDLTATSLSLPGLKELIDESPCDQITLLFDCCFSGAAADAFVKSDVTDQLDIVRKVSGTHILSSSDAQQVSVERLDAAEMRGVFTECVIRGIDSGEADLNGDGEITVTELGEYVQARIRGQNPRYSGLRTSGVPVLAWNRRRIEQQRKEREQLEVARRRKRLSEWYWTKQLSAPIYLRALAVLQTDEPWTPLEKGLHKLIRDFLDDERVVAATFEQAWRDLDVSDDSPTSQAIATPIKVEDTPPNGGHTLPIGAPASRTLGDNSPVASAPKDAAPAAPTSENTQTARRSSGTAIHDKTKSAKPARSASSMGTHGPKPLAASRVLARDGAGSPQEAPHHARRLRPSYFETDWRSLAVSLVIAITILSVLLLMIASCPLV